MCYEDEQVSDLARRAGPIIVAAVVAVLMVVALVWLPGLP